MPVDFTREPIIESVITPKEGCTLAVRSSKGSGQEEYFVDAVEIVSFGSALFFRSIERPKSFLLPVTDYEVLEVREARLVLKNVGLDRSIKIAGGRDASLRSGGRPPVTEKSEESSIVPAQKPETSAAEPKADVKLDKKRDRRRNSRRRRGRDETQEGESATTETEDSQKMSDSNGSVSDLGDIDTSAIAAPTPAVFSSLLPPPPTLISETIARYKDNALFKGAFYLKNTEESSAEAPADSAASEGEEITSEDAASEEKAPSPDRRRGPRSRSLVTPEHPLLDLPASDEEIQLPTISLDSPAYAPPEMTEEEEERVYQQRQALRLSRSSLKSTLTSDDESHHLSDEPSTHEDDEPENVP